MTGPSRESDFDSAPRTTGVLEAMLPALADRLETAVGEMFRTDVHVRLTDYQPVSRGDFFASDAEGCCIRLTAQSTVAHLVLKNETAFGIVDWLLGGSPGGAFVPSRPLTAIEQRLLRRFAGGVARALSQVWQNVDDGAFEVQASGDCAARGQGPSDQSGESVSESGGDAAALQRTPATAATFVLSAGSWQGTITLCLPEIPGGSASPTAAEEAAASPDAVEVSVEVEGPAVTVEELAALECDDIVLTDTPAGGEVIVRVEGQARFAARLGVVGGKRAITITRRLDDSEP